MVIDIQAQRFYIGGYFVCTRRTGEEITVGTFAGAKRDVNIQGRHGCSRCRKQSAKTAAAAQLIMQDAPPLFKLFHACVLS
ncbi:MAG: hypothetical protein B6I36_10795 [Desulfobacteraceae bacterium 4572_35.1]|nr:MAG: hypothetical protein B6I36_10795 [Desulfobacteraceae bacterium 4572_35.1]